MQKSTHTNELSWLVNNGFMTELPLDPIELSYSWSAGKNTNNANVGTWRDFLYFVVTKNNQTSWAIVLATRAETDSRANYVSQKADEIDLTGDFKNIFTCKTVEVNANENVQPSATTSDCKAKDSSNLRYILKFS